MSSVECERTEIPGYTMAFPVVGPNGEDVGRLTITPKAVNTERPGIWCGHLVEVDITLRNWEFTQKAEDYFRIGTLVDLWATLQDLQQGIPGTTALGTVEPGFDLEVAWDELGNDVRFVCSIPSRSGWERSLAQDPLSYRNWIRQWDILEFWIAPEGLGEPIAQLDALLQRLDEFEGEGQRRTEPHS